MIKVMTKVVKTNDDKDTISMKLKTKNDTNGEYFAIATEMVRRLTMKGLDKKEILNIINKGLK